MSTEMAVSARNRRGSPPTARSVPPIAPTQLVEQPWLTITRTALKEALAEVGRVLPTRPGLPILGHVLLVAEDRTLTLTATDLLVCAIRTIDTESPGMWSIAVPGKLLTDVVSALPEGLTITRHKEQQAIRLVVGSFETTIKGQSADEFPHIPPVAGPSITLLGATFVAAIQAVAFAAANDTVRPVLEGVQFSISGTTITLSAADGLRLAQQRINLAEPAQPVEVLVPAGALADLAGMFAHTEQITLTIGDAQIALSAAGRQALLRVIDGIYPDVTRVIPGTYAVRMVIQTAALKQALRPVKLFANESSNIVRLLPSDGLLILTADGREKRIPNKQETLLAQEKWRKFTERFSHWVWDDPVRAGRLCTLYNERFNKRAFDRRIKTWDLIRRGGRVVFATGTPILNSIGEAFIMQLYTRHPYGAWRSARPGQ